MPNLYLGTTKTLKQVNQFESEHEKEETIALLSHCF